MPVAAGQQIPFEPPLALMLGEHLHHPAVRRHVLVGRQVLGGRFAVGHLEDVVPAVRGRLVRAEDAEVPRVGVLLQHVAQEGALHPGGLGHGGAGLGDLHGVIAEMRQPQVAQHGAAVGHGVGAHPPLPLRRQLGDLRPQLSVLVEQLLGAVAAHPLFEHLHVPGMVPHLGQRHMVGAPESPLDRLAVDDLGGPVHPLGERRTIIGQHGRGEEAVGPHVGLDAPDLGEDVVEHRRHPLVHCVGVVPLDVVRRVAIPPHQAVQLRVGDAGEHRGARDLVAVEMQDREHGAVVHGIEELVRVPAGGERAGLGLAVADHAGGDQVGVVEHRPVGVREGVAELAPFVDRSRHLGRRVARDAAREGELLEQALQPRLVLRDVRIDLAVGPLEIGVGHDPRAAVAGAGDVDHVEVVRLDQAVQMDPEEIEPRRRPPMAEQAGLDVLEGQRFLEQRVLVEIDLSHGEIVRGAPPGVHLPEDLGRERIFNRHRSTSLPHTEPS